ncbi:MAG: OB-fold domain-containing protein, partial [Acidimicrobiaceae bacterium]|nr:OB-fold domain-containing protein [Acidimicrobiaceae bacterium]
MANLVSGTGLESRMLPRLDDDNREFWTSGGSGQLRLPRCPACDRWIFPPVRTCPGCGGPAAYEALSGQGTVYTFTVNHHPFNPAVSLPYVIAVVELTEQADLRFTTNIVNCPPESVTVGMPVR